MNLLEIGKIQREFDTKHGWTPAPDDPRAIFKAVQSDVIGVVGEIGEFANIIKKLALEVETGSVDTALLLENEHGHLEEELVDSFIYLIRMASHLQVDLEQAYLGKLKKNEQRYKRFENPRP